jgi:hypothetical protein
MPDLNIWPNGYSLSNNTNVINLKRKYNVAGKDIVLRALLNYNE